LNWIVVRLIGIDDGMTETTVWPPKNNCCLRQLYEVELRCP